MAAVQHQQLAPSSGAICCSRVDQTEQGITCHPRPELLDLLQQLGLEHHEPLEVDLSILPVIHPVVQLEPLSLQAQA